MPWINGSATDALNLSGYFDNESKMAAMGIIAGKGKGERKHAIPSS